MSKFSTALREYARRRLEALEHADILVGIPSYNSQKSIAHVVRMAERGMKEYFPGMRGCVMVADGGSTDDTREECKEVNPSPWNEKLITIYRGIPGKGSALRAVFEAAQILNVRACIVVDSDLRSITPVWIKNLADPILVSGYDFVAPYYTRYKYDGTITNNIVYYLTRGIFGKRIRQPIGGDFAFSRKVLDDLANQDVWDTDVTRFGVDIWMTITAIVRNYRLCQTRLGAKIHDVKDPAENLGPMFRQVIDTFFELIEQHFDFWQSIHGSVPVDLVGIEPESDVIPFSIDTEGLIKHFRSGYENFGSLWKSFLSPDNYREIERLYHLPTNEFVCDIEWWVKTLYECCATFHQWEKNRFKLVTALTPLYYGRIASFVNETRAMNNEEVEALIDSQAIVFENTKHYLLDQWNNANKLIQ